MRDSQICRGPIVSFDFENQQGGNTILETPIDLGYVASTKKVKDMMSTQDGSLCYDRKPLLLHRQS